MMPSAQPVKVGSVIDHRERKLLPNRNGADVVDNNGAVPYLTVDKPLVRRLCGNTPYFALDCVCSKFGRLGMTSRNLVVSLYRAIIERFFIMKASGCCSDRPPFTCVLGLEFLTEVNGHVCFEPALFNMRRTFGSAYFKPTIKRLVKALEEETGNNPSLGGSFTPLASGGLFCKPEGGDTWCAILGNWLHDLSLRKSSWIAPVHYGRGSLINSVLGAYCQAQRAGFVSDAACFAQWWACICTQDCFLDFRDEPLGNFSGYRNCWADALFGYDCGSLDFGDRFYLPALALALRILSVLNVRTVKGCFDVQRSTVKHVKIRASKSFSFTWNCTRPEEFDYDRCIVCLPEVTFGAWGRKTSTALSMNGANAYTTIDTCDSTNPCHLIKPVRGCTVRYYPDGGSGSSGFCGGACATLCAIWPCFSLQCIDHIIIGGGGQFPAKWAWCECDICEGWVTGFAGTTCMPASVQVFPKVFRQKIPGFGGWKAGLDVSIQGLACALSSEVHCLSSHHLGGFPISSGAACSYFGPNCAYCYDCVDWSYLGDHFTYKPGACGLWLADCYGNPFKKIDYCVGFDGYHVARVHGRVKGADYTAVPFGLGPSTVRFGGTFFETYRFKNYAARQGGGQ